MDQPFVSDPMDFNHTRGNAVDFTKTFDLTGNDNDEMLKFYLRKAGLSDDIKYLTSEQKRAFIYDIVKSNKNPGYWKPSVLPQTPTPTRDDFQKTHAQRESTITLESIDDIPPAAMTFDFAKYTQVKQPSSNRYEEKIKYTVERKEITRGTLYERQFNQQQSISNNIINVPPNPTSISTLVTKKGRRIEISGPTNFQHISGDTTRDRTKNAFDLSGTFNNNLLKKYMIERGITDEDVSGLDRKDLIRRIVQSEYTWMPIRPQEEERVVPPPPSETYMAVVSTAPSSSFNKSKNISKGALIVAPPVLPSAVASSSENVYEEIVPIKRNTTSIRRHRKKPLAPPPPAPVASRKVSPIKPAYPCPPQPFTNQNNSPSRFVKSTNDISTPPPPPPPPPPMPTEKKLRTEYSSATTPPPPPPLPSVKVSEEDRPPQAPTSIEKPKAHQFSTAPPKTSGGGPPPPPPPPLPAKTSVLTKQTEPKTQIKSGGGPPPPPPPPPPAETPVHNKHTESKPKTQIKPIETGGDPRDAFLESIRTGVTLKKVSQDKKLNNNVHTSCASMGKQTQLLKTPQGSISRDAPVQQEKPDFMSELRNATLKRIKKLENNPYASESEC